MMETTSIKLQDLTPEQKMELYKQLTNIEYGKKMEVYDAICDTYSIGMNKVYDWKKKLIDAFEAEETPMITKGKSTLYDEFGDVKLQWVKEDVEKKNEIESIKKAIDMIVERVPAREPIKRDTAVLDKDIVNVYISNDLHIGALMSEKETGDKDWDLKVAEETIRHSIDYLVDNSPKSELGVIADLGDTTEADDFKNRTPHSGNPLDVDGRYDKMLGVAMDMMVYMVEKALEKHEKVMFINISGNHDITGGHAIRAYVKAWFRDEPRVTVDSSPKDIKYFRFGSTLLGFAHGDGLKMKDAGETMAVDNEKIWSETVDRYFFFGHTHKESVIDGRLCKAESFRNLAPLNQWAAHKGYRRQVGTMKCKTFHNKWGEIGSTVFNVNMEN